MRNNFIENYVNWTTSFTDAPEQFHRYIAYWILGTVMGRRIWMRMGDEQMFPNIWMVILAPSSFYRKSTCLTIASRMVDLARPNMMLPAEWTREGLISIMQEQPEGAMIAYEFKSLLSLLQRDYNAGAQSILTELYDCPEYYSRKTGVAPIREFRVNCPFLSILAASTLDWLLDTVKGKDVAGGFLARYIFVSANKKTKSMAIQPPSDPLKKKIVIDSLKSLFSTTGQFDYEPAARQYYEDWYQGFAANCDKYHESVRAFFPRLTSYAHKFAMLEALVNNHSPMILLSDVQQACLIADNLAQEVLKLEGESIGATKSQKDKGYLIKILKNHPGLARREFLRLSHMYAQDFNKVLETLMQAGQVELKDGAYNLISLEKEAFK